jgi:hypothetical protein
MSNFEERPNTGESETNNQATSLPVFDPTRYRQHIDDFDISEEQKQELLATLWSIMSSFVELGFRVDVVSALLSPNRIPDDEELS